MIEMDEEDVIISPWLFSELDQEVEEKPLSFVDQLSLQVDKVITQIHAIYQSKIASDCAASYADSKSAKIANEFRNAGITLAKEGNYEEALILHTKSLALAPQDSREEFNAYDERSLVLFRLGRYEDCSLDVNRALKEKSCSSNMKKKLQTRKKDCFEKYREAKGCAMKGGGATDPEELTDREEVAEWKAFSAFDPPNDLLPNSSSKIKAGTDDGDIHGWGSGARATRDIETGEILSIEEYYAMALFRQNRFKHCAYCLVKCDTLIPCASCTQTMYCSRRCRTRAYDSYHRTECQIIKFYDRKGNDWKEPLAVQAFLRGTEQGTRLPALMEKLKPRDIFQPTRYPNNKPFVLDYEAILKLCRVLNEETTLWACRDIVPAVIETVIALQKLQLFFPKNNGETEPDRLNEIELLAALLLLNNMISTAVWNFRIWGKKDMREPHSREITVGSGIFVLQSFLDYSCYPNTQVITKDCHRVLFATRPIKAGEPLFYAFRHSFLFATHAKKDRPEWCECEACINDWPCMDELGHREIRFLKETNMKEWRELLDTNRRMLMKKDPRKASTKTEIRQVVTNLLNFLYNNLETTKPSYDFVACEDMLVDAMETLYSDYHSHNKAKFLQDMQASLVTLKSRVICQELEKMRVGDSYLI